MRRSGVRCREDMDYLEDWDLLLGLLGSGARFHMINEVLCEFRIFGDGNTLERRDRAHFDECFYRVNERAKHVAERLGVARYAQDLARFDFSMREPATDREVGSLIAARALFEGLSPA